MYYSAIGVLAMLVLLIVNWDVLHKSQVYDKPAWIVYRRFLFAVLAYYILDIFWGVVGSMKLPNLLAELLPDAAELENVVRICDVSGGGCSVYHDLGSGEMMVTVSGSSRRLMMPSRSFRPCSKTSCIRRSMVVTDGVM